MTLQQQVQQHLQNTGISLRELSRRSGISHQAIGKILRDTDLECAKYRRVMQLEQQLNDANTAYLSSKSQHERDLQRLKDYQAQIGKAEAMILGLNDSNECLQKQLDHGQAAYSKLYNQLGATRTKYETQLEAANQKEAQLQEQLTEVYATKTRQEAQVMRLRAYVWSLIAALALVVVSGLVVWGGV